ncbi:MAG: hypothetical protein LBQ43_03720 [Holosporales bacterium]|jgi:hypothetical protein|nr:hypothetical protein [Holosporales bacterium]
MKIEKGGDEKLVFRTNEQLIQQFDYVCDRVIKFLQPIFVGRKHDLFYRALVMSLNANSNEEFGSTYVCNLIEKEVNYNYYFMDENSEEYNEIKRGNLDPAEARWSE